MIHTAIFDLDGVIVDTAKYHYQAWNSLAAELGFEFTKDNNEALKGVSRMRSLDILLEVGGMLESFTDEQKEQMATKKNDMYVNLISNMTKDEILPGVESFLMQLRDAGVKIALGSASKNAKLILKKVDVEHLFDAVVDGSMVENAKPDPQVFTFAAELTGSDVSECVVFEDAQAGVEAAHRAGMKCVGVGGSPLLCNADIEILGFENFKLENLKF